MTNIKEVIKDIVGKSANAQFYPPFEDNQYLTYNKNFDDSSKFTFGIQPDSSLRTGLIIEAPPLTPINLYASFKGQLFLNVAAFDGYEISSLRLVILPNDALSLMATQPFKASSLVAVSYSLVDKNEVKTAMEKLLETKGFFGNTLTKSLEGFLSGKGVGIYIDAGQFLGQAATSWVRYEFIGSDGEFLHPLYLLYQWNKLGIIQNTSHKLVTELKLKTINLDIKEGKVIDHQAAADSNLGPYCFKIEQERRRSE